MRGSSTILWGVAIAGCGRFGFEPAADDAAVAVAVRAVAVGGYASCTIVAGELYCFGDNARGQLGIGSLDDAVLPTRVGASRTWIAIDVSDGHSCGIQLGGELYCWGANTYGQLGLGDIVDRSSPTPVALPGPVVQVSAGGWNTIARLDDGSLWCWGRSLEGTCGFGDPVSTPDVLTPQQVPGSVVWSHVKLGQGHALAIGGGQLYGTGRNTSAQLGLGSTVPGQVRSFVPIGGVPAIASLAGAQDTSCVIGVDGTRWCWGDNLWGQQGDGTIATSSPAPQRIDTGHTWHAVALEFWSACGTTDAGFACWGRGLEGQLGDGMRSDSPTPILTFGARAEDIVAFDVGRNHACLLDAQATVRCSGDNADGELGTGDTMRRATWTAVALP